jgi:hypothetical protein
VPARAYFDSWIEFYQDFSQFPPNLPVDIDYGFDSYKVTYCTVDVAPVPTVATGNVSVPRKAGPLSTVALLHGTSVGSRPCRARCGISGRWTDA